MNKPERNPQIKVSIIIPIYNAGQYLTDCLESALQQTLEDIEIICVDDGSTDLSPQILKEYAGTQNNIRLLTHAVNKGEGRARNTGLKEARGDYVFHLDSDDMIPMDALEVLYTQAVMHGSEMVKGSYIMIDSDGSTRESLDPLWAPTAVNTNIYLITPYSQLLRRLGANLKFLNESRSFQWPRIKCNFRKA